MIKSDTIEKLVASLVKFQSEVEPVKKDMDNPFFKSKYADLSGCIEAAKKALAANGLAVLQPTRIDNGHIIVETMLCHSSGQFIAGEYLLNPVKNDPQSMGSAMTYGRRYAYLAILGLAPEDDDAALASGTVKRDNTELTNQFRSAAPRVAAAPVPQMSDIPPPQDIDATAAIESDPGEFVIRHNGYNKGKRIRDVTTKNLEKDIQFWSGKPSADLEFIHNATTFLGMS